MADQSQGSSSYHGPGVICCSVKTFKCTNCCWGLVSLGLFIFGLVGLFINEGFLLFLEENIYILLTIFGGLAFFIVILGTLGVWAKIEIFFICYIFLMGILLLAQILGFVFLMLYLNDIGTVQEVDSVAINAQADFQDQMIIFATNEADKWVDFQNGFDCCGISLEVDNAELETGDLCVNNSAAEQREEDNASFFCLGTLIDLVNDNIVFIAIGVGILSFVQLSAIVSACRLYWVPIWRGGWMFDEDELEQLAQEKNIPLPPKVPIGQPSNVFQRARDMKNRMSFRVQNAVTANPNAPPTQGFLKRLSYNTNANSPFPGRGGGFGMPGAPPPGSGGFAASSGGNGFAGPPQPPGAGFGGPPANPRWKRLSAGFQSIGSKMKNTFRPAPPNMAPKPPNMAPKPPPLPGYAGFPPAGAPRDAAQNDYGSNQRGYNRANPQMNSNRGTDLSSLPGPPRFTDTSYQPKGGRVGGSNISGQPGGFAQPKPPGFAQPKPPGFAPGNSGGAYSRPTAPPTPPSFGNQNRGGFGGQNTDRGFGGQNSGFKAPQQPPAPPPGGLDAFYTDNSQAQSGGKKKKKRRKRSNNRRNRNNNQVGLGSSGQTSGAAAGGGALMNQIRQGKGLRPTQTYDRSGPFF